MSNKNRTFRRAARKAFSANALRRLCVEQDFSDYATKYDLTPHSNGAERFFWWKDNGSKILAVAHLDSVHKGDNTCKVINTANGLMAVSGALDDRLGTYVILEMLPRLGINCDILLTTDEEIGQSTAEDFSIKGKEYNWMIQFDRTGDDVVMYDYETPALKRMVEDTGARVGNGSFSDICMLDTLGVAGFNFGVGYHDYHGPRAYAWLEETFKMVGHFAQFYAKHSDEKLEYDPMDSWGDWGRGYGASYARSGGGGFGSDNFRDDEFRSAYREYRAYKDELDKRTASIPDDCPWCGYPIHNGWCVECNIDFAVEYDLPPLAREISTYPRATSVHERTEEEHVVNEQRQWSDQDIFAGKDIATLTEQMAEGGA